MNIDEIKTQMPLIPKTLLKVTSTGIAPVNLVMKKGNYIERSATKTAKPHSAAKEGEK